MGVKIKDRDERVEMFRLALTLSDISCNYETADLIYDVFHAFRRKGKKFSVSDAVKLKLEHEQKWFDYYNPKGELKFEEVTENSKDADKS